MADLPLDATDEQIGQWLADTGNTEGSRVAIVAAALAAARKEVLDSMPRILAEQSQRGQLAALQPLRRGIEQISTIGRRPFHFIPQHDVLDLIDQLIAVSEEPISDEQLDKIMKGS